MESEIQPKPGQECVEPNKALRLVVDLKRRLGWQSLFPALNLLA